jgi:hypothetical protein
VLTARYEDVHRPSLGIRRLTKTSLWFKDIEGIGRIRVLGDRMGSRGLCEKGGAWR